jgi:CysZ protein
MVSDFARGLEHGLAGARLLLTRPRLWPPVIIPFAISLAVLVAVTIAALALRERILPPPGTLRSILGIATAIAVPVVAVFAFLPVASLVASPFNDLISERVEEIVTGRPVPESEPSSVVGALVGVGRSLANSARTFLRWALLALGVLIASVVLPGVGSLVGLIGGGYLAARFAAWDAIDTPLARWGWSYERRLELLRRRRPLCLGAGTVVAVALAIPVVNALAMPIAAAGGTVLALATVPEADRRPSPR